MWETIFGFGFLVMGSIWTIGFLALFILWLVHEDSNGWAVFWMAALAALLYNIFQIDTMTFLIGSAAYIPIGVCWSFHRWKRFCNRKVEGFNEERAAHKLNLDLSDPGEQRLFDSQVERRRDSLETDLLPGRNITRLVNWIIVWPFSVVENVIGDIYDMLVTLVKKHLISLYGRISASALSKAQ